MLRARGPPQPCGSALCAGASDGGQTRPLALSQPLRRMRTPPPQQVAHKQVTTGAAGRWQGQGPRDRAAWEASQQVDAPGGAGRVRRRETPHHAVPMFPWKSYVWEERVTLFTCSKAAPVTVASAEPHFTRKDLPPDAVPCTGAGVPQSPRVSRLLCNRHGGKGALKKRHLEVGTSGGR